MYIGGSIFLLAVGAILGFAVTETIPGIDLPAVGFILMAAGALGLILSLFLNAQQNDGGRRRDDYPQ